MKKFYDDAEIGDWDSHVRNISCEIEDLPAG